MLQALKAQGLGDLGNVHIGKDDQFLGLLDALLTDILHGGKTRQRLEFLGKIDLFQSHLLRKVGKGDFPGEVLADIALYDIQKFLLQAGLRWDQRKALEQAEQLIRFCGGNILI